jgi:orotate phosphoribosyltransferase
MDSSQDFDLSLKRQKLLSIITRRSVLRGNFLLTSGRVSNFFIDLKKTMFDPEGASLLADLLFETIRTENVDCIGGMETGAIPLVAALCLRSWPDKPINGFFIRKEPKGHGTDRRIDGLLEPTSRVILFEDVTTTGGSALRAAEEVRRNQCTIVKVITVVDRLEGAEENFRKSGIPFAALFVRGDFD